MIQKVLESDLLLNLASHEAVAWCFVKMISAYKYVGLLV
jgi:hypothetical protein